MRPRCSTAFLLTTYYSLLTTYYLLLTTQAAALLNCLGLLEALVQGSRQVQELARKQGALPLLVRALGLGIDGAQQVSCPSSTALPRAATICGSGCN